VEQLDKPGKSKACLKNDIKIISDNQGWKILTT